MLELLRNAWMGWQQYIEKGRIAALLLAVFLFLGFYSNRKNQSMQGNQRIRRVLLVYGGLLAAFCIFPLTAAILMSYQTRFYDYQWIWSLVPVVMLIALGGTIFFSEVWGNCERGKIGKWKACVATAGLVTILFLCGGLGEKDRVAFWAKEESGTTRALVELKQKVEGETICLWAPQEIMESARSCYGEIRLPYGRNMWDASLNAYVYETYDEALQQMYGWMCETEALLPEAELIEELRPTAEEKSEWRNTGSVCICTALERGVNTFLFPGDLDEEYVVFLQEQLQTEAVLLEGYYLFYKDGE